MKLFKDYTMAWWEVGLLKLYVMVVGMMVGAYFADFVMKYIKVFLLLFALLAIYFIYKMLTDGFAVGQGNQMT